MPHKIIIDTDIGDDIDDAMALAYALGSPEFDILGVCTVYGDVVTRARIATRLCRAWGREDIPIIVGAARPMGFHYYWQREPGQDMSQGPAVKNDPPLKDETPRAATFIAETIRANPNEVTVITLGAMSNLGMAFCQDPELANLCHVSTMGFLNHKDRHDIAQIPGWNIPYDPIAAQCVARSNVPWITTMGGPRLTHDFLSALADSTREADQVLAELIYLKETNKDGFQGSSIKELSSISACDVWALVALLDESQFGFKQGRWHINEYARCDFYAADNEPHKRPYASPSADCVMQTAQRILGKHLGVPA